MIATLLFAIFIITMLMGVPIGASLGLAGAAAIALANSDTAWFGLLAVPQNFYAGLGKYPLLAMVASSGAVARNRHIRIEFFADSGPEKRQRALAVLGAALVALLFIGMAVLSVRLVWDDIRYGETSPGIGVPQWWYSMWLPICSALITLRALQLFLRQGRPGAFVDEEKAP